MSIFDHVRRSAGDVDREQGRDLHDRLHHSRRASPSSTSTRSANQPRRARPVLAELDELRAHIEDLPVRAKEVGDDNHSPFTREIKEEPSTISHLDELSTSTKDELAMNELILVIRWLSLELKGSNPYDLWHIDST